MDRTNSLIEKLNIKTRQDQTLVFNKSDNTSLADISESFIETCHKEDKINPFHVVSLP